MRPEEPIGENCSMGRTDEVKMNKEEEEVGRGE